MRNNNYAQHRTASANGRKSDFWASPRIPRLLRGNTPPQYRHENTHASTKKERQKEKRTGTRTYTSHPPPYRRTYAGQTETKFRKRTHRAKRNKGKTELPTRMPYREDFYSESQTGERDSRFFRRRFSSKEARDVLAALFVGPCRYALLERTERTFPSRRTCRRCRG